MADDFVSNYTWLIAPGDSVYVDDYETPTVFKTWNQTNPLSLPTTDAEKQKRYGHWLAQLLQQALKLSPNLATLYKENKGQTAWPLTLRADVIKALDDYFADEMKP